jgi:hypothetical protein
VISKNGTYWSTGITVHWRERVTTRNGAPVSGWGASLDFFDDGFTNDNADQGEVATEGTLHTRYSVCDGDTTSGLSAAVDALLADAARLGIAFRVVVDDRPHLYYKGDGCSEDYPTPDGWRETLAREAARIGWQSAYTPAAVTTEGN